MLQNYVKTAFRNLVKQRFYSLINIFGLAVGVACCLLILLFVKDELSYDQHHEKSGQIYRIAADIKFGSMERAVAIVSAPMGQTMVEDYPEVLAAARFRNRGSNLVKRKDDPDNLKEELVTFADQSVFDIFSFEVLEGNQEEALSHPNQVVISKSAVDKYFPEGNALGEILTFDNQTDYKITAIIADMPANAHFHFDFMLAMEGLAESKQQVWMSHNFHTYLLLAEDTDPDALEAKFPEMVDKYVGPQLQQFMQIDVEEFAEQGNYLKYTLQPLADIHLSSNLLGEFEANGDMVYVYLFLLVALFILVIACINFMNLSTARSANRAREVGIRKVLGSFKSHLIAQFLIESLLVSFMAFGLAILMSEMSLSFFNNISGKALTIPYGSGWFIPLLLLASITIGILSGIYPAFFLSAFQPIIVLKGKLSTGAKSGVLRGGLVVFQFFISVVLIIGTLIVQRQLAFIQNKKVGFDKEQLLIINDTYVMKDQVYAFKEELLKFPEVSSASVSGFLPVDGYGMNNTLFWPEGKKNEEEQQLIMQNWNVDHDYIKTLGMTIMDGGRDFSLDFPTDSNAVILNETAAKNFGFEKPVGERIQTYTSFPDGEGGTPEIGTFTVIGVVENFHFESLKENIGSLGLFIGRSRSLVSLRLKTEDIQGTLAKVEDKWKEFAGGQPLVFQFLDDQFERMYTAEARVGKIFNIFASLAIFIACLGLFALAAFMAEQRKKEIGIRKVLGASATNIMSLLTRDFTKLILIALLPAIPLAWWGMSKWLENYSYHIDLSFDIFFIAGISALLIAWLTVSYQAFKAAMINPVESLRDE